VSEKVFTDYLGLIVDDEATMKTIEKLPPQGFTDFDLPVVHLQDGWHYVPPKSHDPAEIARRRDLNAGTLCYEQQEKGLIVAHTILNEVIEEEGLLFAADMLSMAGLNSAWYSYAQLRTDVMRRRLKLPTMRHARSRASGTFMADADDILVQASAHAKELVHLNENKPKKTEELQKKVGRVTGNGALRLAALSSIVHGEFPNPELDSNDDVTLDDVAMQTHLRSIVLSGLGAARTAYLAMGAHPSLAQLADPYSPMSVYWHRHSPGSAQTAVVEALAA
jgi:hypothetical protein